LDDLASGQITPDEAQKIFDAALSAGQVGLGEGVGMNNAEYTAHCQGVWFSELARWRKKGWPEKCARCGRRIDVPNFGWIAKETKPDGDHFLQHIDCPPKR
jgi:hypothetical protein